MDWTESAILKITTRRVIYFDKLEEFTCRKICKVLIIDLFPDYDGNSYRKLEKGNEWVRHRLSDNQKIDASTPIFDQRVIKAFEDAPSNLLFIFDGDHFKGVVHFTDYRRKIVYDDLYKNFYEFEKNLRELLIIKRFGVDQIIDYFNYKAIREPKGAEGWEKKKSKISRERNNNPLDLLSTRDLLHFCVSSFHKAVKPWNIDRKDIAPIGELRNIVMHNKDNVGLSSTVPHEYKKFREKFFQPVQLFRRHFDLLNLELGKYRIAQVARFNRLRLQTLNSLEDEELQELFSDDERYV